MPSGLSICVSSQAWSLLSTPLVLSTLGAQSSPLAPQSRAPVPCMKLGEVDRPMGRVSQAFCVCVSFYLCDPEDSQKVLKLNRFFRKKTKITFVSASPSQSVNPECSFRQQQQDQSQNQTPINSSFHPAPRKGKAGPECQGQATDHSDHPSGGTNIVSCEPHCDLEEFPILNS